MISYTTERFRKMFPDLPESIQRQARKAYKQFQTQPASRLRNPFRQMV
jgi:hypothetical protein